MFQRNNLEFNVKIRAIISNAFSQVCSKYSTLYSTNFSTLECSGLFKKKKKERREEEKDENHSDELVKKISRGKEPRETLKMPGTKCISRNPRKPGSSRRETALRNACIPLEKGHRYADARLSVSSVLSRRSEKFARQFPHDAAALSSSKLETGSTRTTAPSVAGCVPEIGLLPAAPGRIRSGGFANAREISGKQTAKRKGNKIEYSDRSKRSERDSTLGIRAVKFKWLFSNFPSDPFHTAATLIIAWLGFALIFDPRHVD